MMRWQRDRGHAKLAGVCAGVARGLGISRVTVRLVALFALILMPPLALALYLAAILLMTPRAEVRRWLD
ncbi:PspC domain-containing protein [Aeromonas simiae]|uniref:PspC domain-containing protein n=1 Tax=Aeromonas simiae TaxID=218936 RepID=A0A5J6X0D5_9GAMM|nr:PspC domain-containing protein [Aeromonas simiae]QFI55638.1 PspC domain-containing protein [Aeromonas simiae]